MYKVNPLWLHGALVPYFETQGIKLLKDDLKFIEKCLQKIPENFHRKVMRDYLRHWNGDVAIERKNSIQDNLGRFRANSYLRDFCG
jgi:hypothetical protein